MTKFEVGDWVFASDWCYGQILKIVDDIAVVEYDTSRGGGNCSFMIRDLEKANAPEKNFELTINVDEAIRELESSKYCINDSAYARGANDVINYYIRKLKECKGK